MITRAQLVDFIADNPGFTTRELADHFGVSNKHLRSKLHYEKSLGNLGEFDVKSTVIRWKVVE